MTRCVPTTPSRGKRGKWALCASVPASADTQSKTTLSRGGVLLKSPDSWAPRVPAHAGGCAQLTSPVHAHGAHGQPGQQPGAPLIVCSGEKPQTGHSPQQLISERHLQQVHPLPEPFYFFKYSEFPGGYMAGAVCNHGPCVVDSRTCGPAGASASGGRS